MQRTGLKQSEETIRRRTKSLIDGKQKVGTSGFRGVYLHKLSGKFMANCKRNSKNHYVGLFPTAKEAHLAREEYLKSLCPI